VAQKKLTISIEEKRRWIDPDHKNLSVARQCELLGLARSSRYYHPAGESPENLALMRRIDEQYTKTPFYGSRKLALELGVNRKRVHPEIFNSDQGSQFTATAFTSRLESCGAAVSMTRAGNRSRPG
jgi:hypothetical protein